jgi:Holliday junction resolvase RusA-like endonuclease
MIVIYGQLYSKKNSKQIFKNRKTGKHFITSSEVYKQSENHLIAQLLQNKREFITMLLGKKPPYSISFKIYRESKHRFDYNNISHGLLDCMVKAGLLDDDNANEVIPVFEPYEVDGIKPRVEIKVL